MTLTIELSPQRYTEPASGHSTFRADAAFAKAEIYEMPRGGKPPDSAHPANDSPMRDMEELWRQSLGRPIQSLWRWLCLGLYCGLLRACKSDPGYYNGSDSGSLVDTESCRR
jgi:hypothetical protein